MWGRSVQYIRTLCIVFGQLWTLTIDVLVPDSSLTKLTHKVGCHGTRKRLTDEAKHSLSYLQLRMPQEAPLGWYTTNCECPVSLVCTFRRLLSKTQNASVRIVHLKLPTSLSDHVPGPITSPNNITTAHIPKKSVCKTQSWLNVFHKIALQKQHFWAITPFCGTRCGLHACLPGSRRPHDESMYSKACYRPCGDLC